MLSLILGILLLVVSLIIVWLRGYAKGYKECSDSYIKIYYTPMYNRDTKVLQEMCSILSDNPEQQLQRNIKLHAENRRLKKKAILLACKYGKATKKIKLTRLEETFHWLQVVMEQVTHTNFRNL